MNIDPARDIACRLSCEFARHFCGHNWESPQYESSLQAARIAVSIAPYFHTGGPNPKLQPKERRIDECHILVGGRGSSRKRFRNPDPQVDSLKTFGDTLGTHITAHSGE